MKKLVTIGLLLLSSTAFSDDKYTPPKVLSETEAQDSRTTLINNKITLLNHWKTRLVRAQQNNDRLVKSGAPLQRPYYGDSGLSQHQH